MSKIHPAEDVDLIACVLEQKLKDLRAFCDNNGIALLAVTSLYDRLTDDETITSEWCGPATSLVGLAYLADQIGKDKAYRQAEDLVEIDGEDQGAAGSA